MVTCSNIEINGNVQFSGAFLETEFGLITIYINQFNNVVQGYV